MLPLVCLLCVVSGALGQGFNGANSTWYCGFLVGHDCGKDPIELRCGTDGVTYRNRCALGAAHCLDVSVHQAHTGACINYNDTITLSPEEVIHGSEIVLDYQCVLLGHQTCQPAINEKICGTDGITYSDFCEYEKARCMHRDLHVKHMGDCAA